jgi:hypothetical protein
MHGQDRKGDSEKETRGESYQEKPAAQWKEIFQSVRHDFSRSYLPNAIIALICLLVGPAVGVAMKSPKIIVVSAVIGLTLALWFAGYFIYKRIPEAAAPEQPRNLPSATPLPWPPPSSEAPKGTPSPEPQEYDANTSSSAIPLTFTQEKPVPEKKSQNLEPSRSIKQSMVNSPGGIQAGGNVTVNKEPGERHLTPQQRSELLKLLTVGPKGEFTIVSILSAPDAAGFSEELASVLIEAGWTLRDRTVAIFSFKGLLIRVRRAEKMPTRARVLQHALRAVGFITDGEFISELADDDEVFLIVGSKP